MFKLNRILIPALIISTIIGGITETLSQTSDVKSIHGNTTNYIKETTHDSTKHSSRGSFIPVPYIITDQNLGFGGVLALGYIHPNKDSKSPPNVSGFGGGYTSTKTWMAMIGHSHSFNNDHIRYLGGIAVTSTNLDFYQIGNIDLSDHPIGVNLKGAGTVQRVQFQIEDSKIFIGPQYSFLYVNSSFNIQDEDHPFLDSLAGSIDNQTYQSALGLILDYDNRDNTLSPNKGFYTGFDLSYNATWLGATQDFSELNTYFYAYVPLTKWLYSIYHFDAKFSGGDVPFYRKPYVKLRGAPMMRYQGNETMLAEVQFRAFVYKAFAVVAYTGAGKAFDSFSEFDSGEWVTNYGFGLRYELKKAFGTRVGLDFAWANKQFGWYVVIGTGL